MFANNFCVVNVSLSGALGQFIIVTLCCVGCWLWLVLVARMLTLYPWPRKPAMTLPRHKLAAVSSSIYCVAKLQLQLPRLPLLQRPLPAENAMILLAALVFSADRVRVRACVVVYATCRTAILNYGRRFGALCSCFCTPRKGTVLDCDS